MIHGKVTGYSNNPDTGTIKCTESGEEFSFRSTDIQSGAAPHSLVGKNVFFEITGDNKITLDPKTHEIAEPDHLDNQPVRRFSGYFSLNDAFAGYFSNIIMGLHIITIASLIIGLLRQDILGSFGVETLSQRFIVILFIFIIYVLIVGLLTTFVSINEHLRELNRRQR